MRRGFIYVRVSDEKQEEGYGRELQLAACQAYCAANDVDPIRVFDEGTFSARNEHSSKRDELTQIRNAIRGKEIDVVVCYDVSRLSRKAVHTMPLMDEARMHGSCYEFAKENFEDDPIGHMVMFIRATMAELEGEKIVERTQGGLRQRVENGMPLVGPKAPYGYKWLEEAVGPKQKLKKTRLKFDEREILVVRRIFRELLSGSSATKVAQGLNRDGIVGGKGGRWTASSVSKLVRNPTYKGQPHAYRYVGRHDKSRGNGYTIPQEGISVGRCEAVVTDDEWQAVIDRIESSKSFSVRNLKNAESALLRNGHLVCGHCGHHLLFRDACIKRYTYKDKVYEYQHARTYFCGYGKDFSTRICRNAVDGAKIDEAVWSFLKEKMKRPKEIFARLNKGGEDPTKIDHELATNRLAEVERRLKNLRDGVAAIDDEDTREELIADINLYASQRMALKDELRQINERRGRWAAERRDALSIETVCRRMAQFFDEELPFERKRQILRMLAVRVFVFRDKIPTIEWSLPNEEVKTENLFTFVGETALVSTRV